MKQPGFFDVKEHLARLRRLGDQLEAFSRTVDFEVFRPNLEKTLVYSDRSKDERSQQYRNLISGPIASHSFFLSKTVLSFGVMIRMVIMFAASC